MRAAVLLAPPIRRAALLCLTAGYVDAYGYVDLGGVFAANMTGNTVLLGIALARGDWVRLPPYALTLAAFFLGAMAASVLKRAFTRVFLPLLLAAALLAAAERLGLTGDLELLLLAFAMGLQGASLTRFGTTSLQTVVVTSTLLNLADGCVRHGWHATVGAQEPGPEMPLLGAAWLAYAVGAAAGILVSAHIGLPLVLPAVLLVVVAIDLAVAPRSGG